MAVRTNQAPTWGFGMQLDLAVTSVMCLELPKTSQETTEITCALRALKGCPSANSCEQCKQQGEGCHFP